MNEKSKDFYAMILFNAIFIIIYLYVNWVEYSELNASQLRSPWQLQSIGSNFPWGYQISSSLPGSLGIYTEIWHNFPLFIFLVAIIANVYFLFRLKREKETNH